MSQFQLEKFYNFKKSESNISAMLKPPSPKQLVEEMIAFLLVIISTAFLGGVGIIKGNLFYAITGCATLLLVIIGSFFGYRSRKNRQIVFRFTIGKDGVTLIDIDGNFYIPWSEISSFGLVNCNSMSGGTVRETQACMYFSRELLDERALRKTLCRRVEKTGSSSKTIVFCFFFDTDKYEEYDLFRKYIYMYCDKSKERNYVGELLWK